MEDNIFTLKYDLQQCIANNINILDTEYELLFFEDKFMNLVSSLECFEHLEISPCGSKMKFKGEVAKDLKFTKEDLLKVKQIVWKQNLAEAMKQAIDNKKSEEQKFKEHLEAQEQLSNLLIEKQNEQYDFREATLKEKQKLQKIRKELLKMGMRLNLEEEEEMILLGAKVNEIKLNRNQLRCLVDCARKFNVFIIAPIYDEEDYRNEECLGIRIALGIDLMV